MIGSSQEALNIYKREDDWEHATQMELRRWHTAPEAGEQRHNLKTQLRKAFGWKCGSSVSGTMITPTMTMTTSATYEGYY